MTGVRLYFRYAAISVRSQLEYRVSALLQMIGMFFVTGIDFIAIVALFDRFGTVRGWELSEIALFYGTISVSWTLAEAIARGFEGFGPIVKAGDFDRLLLRPRSTVLQLLGHELTVRRLGRFLQGAVILGYALATNDIDWSVARVVLLAMTIGCASCMFLGLCILQATSAFWTTETLEVWNAFTYGGVTMAQYPLAIYRDWFRKFFMYVIPLGAVGYLPGVALLGREDPLGTPVLVQWLAPLAGPAFLALSLAAWRIGVRHYRSTGS